MKQLRTMRDLQVLRNEIDAVDEQMIVLLAERFKLTNEVGIYKAHNDVTAIDPAREAAKFSYLAKRAEELNLNPVCIIALWRLVIDEVVVNHKAIAKH